MSRHRLVRNLDVNELLEEDEYYSDEQQEEDQLSAEDNAAFQSAVQHVSDTIEGSGIPLKEIQDAVYYYYFDTEKAVNYLLSQKAKAEKKVAPKPKSTSKAKDSTSGIVAKTKSLSVAGPRSSEESPNTAKHVKVEDKTPAQPKPKKLKYDIPKLIESLAGRKPSLSFVVIGHVDAGKSTLMGRLLYDSGEVAERTMRKFQKESSEIGKSSFSLAWVMDQSAEERERGVTIDIAQSSFETSKARFTILDAPGHKDFVPNMIAGTSQADLALLVIDSSTDAFESGFKSGGQTREHALLARSLGCRRIIVVVNKLDTVGWSEHRYTSIVEEVTYFLSHIGFSKNSIRAVPCSGLTGENVTKRSTLEALSWYKGNSLLAELDSSVMVVNRDYSKPLAMSINDIFRGGISSSVVAVAGRIQQGSVQPEMEVMICPTQETATVKSVMLDDGDDREWAVSGDTITIELTNLDDTDIKVGDVLCSANHPLKSVNMFKARIVTFENMAWPLLAGVSFELIRGRTNRSARVTKIHSILDKATGQVVKKRPRHVGSGMAAMVEIIVDGHAMPMTTFKDNKELGRMILRKEGMSIAAAVVDELIEKEYE
ncbi:hypothetical protein CANCADRAFT_57956 [Tortispora caseinolytica NRRL Y-17796]|uniref:Elongation factor 1 alpha-like protein n=1 Tax=Tortispora caseinolytica NRRL Y-17796 TaxID=767744 RepID=A0A1E4TAW7_9ASCO|nr:hypothetical protein CANCADRAFT_57956 [Tortispora caseinolytica NRRL Y-17796]